MNSFTHWTDLKVQIPAGRAEEATAIAQMVVPYGLYLEDYSDLVEVAPQIAHIDLIDEELLARDRTTAIIHLYIKPDENPAEAISFLHERLDAAHIPHSLLTDQVKEEDWATAWKKYYHPIPVGSRLVICPSWERYDRDDGRTVLQLDPGMAFGTGTHDTTRLCLTLIEEYCRQGRPLLDVGCGSGILAIAARLLGASPALGIDIDTTAVRVAEENARLNGVADRSTFVCGDLTQKASGTYPLICANIVADIIIRLLPDLPRFLEPEGVFVASGIITEREADVTAAFAANGFQIRKRLESGGWVAFAVAR